MLFRCPSAQYPNSSYEILRKEFLQARLSEWPEVVPCFWGRPGRLLLQARLCVHFFSGMFGVLWHCLVVDATMVHDNVMLFFLFSSGVYVLT